jgi:N-acetylglucosaminyl-diphospho-decaprenol L-rhamnosyltransferase
MSPVPSGERVTAVIVHFRTPEETVAAAQAVAQTAPRAEIVVVDNASKDGVGEALARRVPAARLVVENANRGYGAACNRGARESGRPYLLFLNSDAVVRPGALAALVAALDGDSRAAAVGPRMLNPDGSLQASIRRLPTPWRIFCESSGLAFLSGGRGPLEGHTATRQEHGRAREVEALMGAALLARRDAFEAVGEFDEAFFLYAEETDLMARWGDAGWRILYEPAAEVVHAGGRSGGDRLFGQLHESLVRYTAKHHGRAAAILARGFLDAGAVLRYGAALLTPGREGRARRARYRAALLQRDDPRVVPS